MGDVRRVPNVIREMQNFPEFSGRPRLLGEHRVGLVHEVPQPPTHEPSRSHMSVARDIMFAVWDDDRMQLPTHGQDLHFHLVRVVGIGIVLSEYLDYDCCNVHLRLGHPQERSDLQAVGACRVKGHLSRGAGKRDGIHEESKCG